jgi:hypothetical protein
MRAVVLRALFATTLAVSIVWLLLYVLPKPF